MAVVAYASATTATNRNDQEVRLDVTGAHKHHQLDHLETPARGKPHIDQHQRRALRRSIAETAGYIQMRSAAGPLRAGTAAFEPLQRLPAVFHRPDIVESLKCTAGWISLFCMSADVL